MLGVEETLTYTHALVALYEAAGGSGWANRDGWLSSEYGPCGAYMGDAHGWFGVLCGSGEQWDEPVRLKLGSNSLVGTLPSQLGRLTALTTLELTGCKAPAEAMQALAKLTALTTLRLLECSSTDEELQVLA